VQAASPALEKEFAAHKEQTVLFVTEQAEDGKAPAAHEAQVEHGAKLVALHEAPATHAVRLQARFVEFQA